MVVEKGVSIPDAVISVDITKKNPERKNFRGFAFLDKRINFC